MPFLAHSKLEWLPFHAILYGACMNVSSCLLSLASINRALYGMRRGKFHTLHLITSLVMFAWIVYYTCKTTHTIYTSLPSFVCNV